MKISIEDISKGLQTLGFHVHVQEKSEYIPFEQLYLHLGKDYNDRDVYLQMYIMEQSLELYPNKVKTFRFLHFFVGMPFVVSEKTFNDCARFASLINKVSLPPGFGVSETDKAITFHHVHYGEEEISEEVMQMLISSIAHAVDTYQRSFEDIASERQNLQTIVEEANNKLK